MTKSMNFDFRDILWAPAKAFSAKKIFVATFFLCLSLIIYNIFTYLSLILDGESVKFVFSVFGFFPFYKVVYSHIIAQIVFLVGIGLSVVVIMLGLLGASILEVEALRGNRFFSAWGAIAFSFRRGKQIFLSELALVLFIAFIIIAIALFGLVCRIPFIGAWLYALLFLIPGFIIALLAVFILAVFLISIILLPSIAAAERKGESFTAILETFSTIIRQPLRWLFYTAYVLVAAKIVSFVYAYFCYRAVQFLAWSAKLGGGINMERWVKAGLAHLPVKSDIVRETFNIFPGIDWSVSLSKYIHGGSYGASTHLMALMLFLIFISIIGYFLSVIATGQARTYIVIRYYKDDYNIVAEKPLMDDNFHDPKGTS